MHHLRTTLALLASLALTHSTARAQIVERLDVSTAGAFGNVAAHHAVVSDDGQIAAFLSPASNLVLPDDAVSIDVFVRNRTTGTTTRIASDTKQGQFLEISGDGRWVVYAIAQPGPPQFTHQAFVHDLSTGTTTQVATSFGDVVPGAITPDGRFLVIHARSTLVPFLPHGAWRLDLQTGTLLLASRDMPGMLAGVIEGRDGVSPDGEFLVFASAASVLVPGDSNNSADVFLFRASTGLVERLSVDDLGVEGNHDSFRPSISADGLRIAFESRATNFDPTDTNAFPDVYLRDLDVNTTRRLSFAPTGAALAGSSGLPLISASGGEVVFETDSPELIPGDGPSTTDLFVRDLSSEITRAVTPGSTVFGARSSAGSISSDGRFIALRCTFTSLPDAGTTGGAYLADFGPGCSASGYCTALPNSTGEAATIGAQGEASFLLNNFTLSALNLPPNAIAIFASGTASIDPGVPFGNGLLCIGGVQTRYRILHASNGVVIDFQDLTLPVYAGVQPGDVRYYQCIYRDPAAGGASFNTTDAVAVTFCF